MAPRPQFLVDFGGFAAKINQKTSRGGFAAPNSTAGGEQHISRASLHS
jgi:hypothetical protein